jgi:integrase
MRVFKKGKFYHFEFEFAGKRFQGSTRRKNEREAIQIAGAKQFNIMKASVGLGSKDPAPTVRVFQKTFDDWVEQDIEDQGTRDFYTACYSRFIDCPHTADVRLDAIDERTIEKFKTWALTLDSVKTKTTVNRYLATLSKALHYAADNLKLIERLPKIHKFPKSKTCERERDFIFSDKDYNEWVKTSPEPLRSASILARNCGMSRNELIALQKDCVLLTSIPDDHGFFGVIDVKRGLKRESRKRKLPITEAMREVLIASIKQSKCKFVLTSPQSPGKAMSPNTIEDQIRRIRSSLELPKDSGLHALRHTFLTEAGKLTQNVKALQLLAGHSNIATTMKYIHPEESDVFGVVAAMKMPKAKSDKSSKANKAATAGSA